MSIRIPYTDGFQCTDNDRTYNSTTVVPLDNNILQWYHYVKENLNMATKKPQVKAYVEPELKEKLAEIWKQENRSESNMIELLIKRYVEEFEAQHKKEERKHELGQSSNSRTG